MARSVVAPASVAWRGMVFQLLGNPHGGPGPHRVQPRTNQPQVIIPAKPDHALAVDGHGREQGFQPAES
ncbi:hypothetical protein Hypma_011873 [Hypsizygus marmoreus]|uniref:Uncharacterized protein n=1 Tax=Hypsizygus marmoreus TaxID=39966 RepID=A0A369JRK8_HYPMA|nr:hypothetical protein Hypma_011873 [Hypsizygus marmoreus]